MNIRYYPETMHRSIIETLFNLFETGRWERTWTLYLAVRPGEKGYEDAPYETSSDWQVMHRICLKNPNSK
jgi:hypothetical protein